MLWRDKNHRKRVWPIEEKEGKKKRKGTRVDLPA
jgi:hypothetical protein